jgi:hypothetical protein
MSDNCAPSDGAASDEGKRKKRSHSDDEGGTDEHKGERYEEESPSTKKKLIKLPSGKILFHLLQGIVFCLYHLGKKRSNDFLKVHVILEYLTMSLNVCKLCTHMIVFKLNSPMMVSLCVSHYFII